ncbi:MmgE/PrpD family protein [Falsigemmobacter faecalis]|nr:MmgE/PrpD family protein [Falsigemmobacter faecalis]
MTDYTRQLSEWAAGLRYEDIPDDCIAMAKEQLHNVLGAIFLSTEAESARNLIAAVQDYEAAGPCTVIGTGEKMTPVGAAVVNSFAAQLFEYEDWVLASHAGASVLPTALAVGEAAGSDGRAVLTAIVIGNELAGRTGRAILRGAYLGNSLPNHQVDTSFIASKLLGLDAEGFENAVGLSCFMAMESCPVGFLTDAKGLINSLPAQVGITTAYMARRGLKGSRGTIEHPAGYLWTVSEDVDLTQLTVGLGEDWVIRSLRSKPYPICGYNIAAIEGALILRRRHNIDPAQIDSVTVYAPASTLFAGTRFHSLQPDVFTQYEQGCVTHMPLLFDVPYPVAAALYDGTLTPDQFAHEKIMDQAIRDLASRVTLRVDEGLNTAYYNQFKFGSRIEITLKSGAHLVETVEDMPGSPANPFDVREKFIRGATRFMSQERAQEASALIDRLETSDVRMLMAALCR